jgi:integrase
MSRNYYSVYGPFIAQFIALKNSLGYHYKDAGTALSLLDKLAFQKQLATVAITKELADEYALKRPNESEKTRYNRMQLFSQFARFLSDLGLSSYIPQLPRFTSTFVPYIFSQAQMQAIFTVCDGLLPSCRNRNSAVFTIPFLIRLLYGTGVRINEALYLSCQDIQDNYFILRMTKNGQDRMVPMSDSLTRVCKDYLTYRTLFIGAHKTDKVFILPDGKPLTLFVAYKWFRKILWMAKISHGGRGKGPRLHDLRHTFSVHSFATMAKQGLDLYHSLPLLATYLGHQSLEATDGYVRLTAEMYPELIQHSAGVAASVFPVVDLTKEEDETY